MDIIILPENTKLVLQIFLLVLEKKYLVLMIKMGQDGNFV
jgi:hypothetical protein